MAVPLLENETVGAIAAAHKVTAAQVLVRFAVERGHTVVPKGTGEAHLRANLDVQGFTLSEEDMKALLGLNMSLRFNDVSGVWKCPIAY